MKKLCITILFTVVIVTGKCFSQSYLGSITSQANVLWEPESNSRKVTTLDSGRQIFIDSLITKNDFCYIIDIGTNNEGYVHKDYVLVDQPLQIDEGQIFTITGEGPSVNPELEIINKTSKAIVVKLNNQIYLLQPSQKSKISLEPGRYKCLVSAPGVVPYIGIAELQENLSNRWAFSY